MSLRTSVVPRCVVTTGGFVAFDSGTVTNLTFASPKSGFVVDGNELLDLLARAFGRDDLQRRIAVLPDPRSRRWMSLGTTGRQSAVRLDRAILVLSSAIAL